MNKYTQLTLVFAVILTLSSSGPLEGKEIYTWTDENGVTHYVDTPPDQADAVSMEAPEAYRPGSSSAYQETESTDTGSQSSYADEKREELAENRAAKQKEAAEKTAVCSSARSELEKIEPSRRVFYTNEEGETARMDDVQRTDRVAELKAVIAQYCQ